MSWRRAELDTKYSRPYGVVEGICAPSAERRLADMEVSLAELLAFAGPPMISVINTMTDTYQRSTRTEFSFVTDIGISFGPDPGSLGMGAEAFGRELPSFGSDDELVPYFPSVVLSAVLTNYFHTAIYPD